MKKAILFCGLMSVMLLASCADSKEFIINNQDVLVEPYGWMNKEALKNDSVIYKVNTGNVIWSVLGFETIVLPLYLTGTELYEPVRKK